MDPVTLRIPSETAQLNQVIVHTPGAEMDLVSPANREELLFEDILFVSHARKEHQLMCRVFEKVIGPAGAVVQISTLLREALEFEEARERFVEMLCAVSPGRNLQAYAQELKQLPPDELSHFALAGKSSLPINALPLPNLLFMRDLAAVVGDHIVLSHAATSARARESVIMNVVVHHHPAFAAYRDRVIKLPPGLTFEGGDLLVASEDTVLIGNSERTSFGSVIAVAKELFDRTAIRNVIMVNLPKERSCMHLDTVFTFASPNECVVYPPLIEKTGQYNIIQITPGDTPMGFSSHIHDSLHEALEVTLGREMTFAPCGGHDPLSQQREQWTDGANLFAIAPGVVIGYERNALTFDELARLGYRVVTAQGFLSFYEESTFKSSEKMAIKLDGHELSRGRGGPRCMTMPLART